MNKKRKMRTFVIPTGSIKAFGNFRNLIGSLTLNDKEKEDILESYNEQNDTEDYI